MPEYSSPEKQSVLLSTGSTAPGQYMKKFSDIFDGIFYSMQSNTHTPSQSTKVVVLRQTFVTSLSCRDRFKLKSSI